MKLKNLIGIYRRAQTGVRFCGLTTHDSAASPPRMKACAGVIV